MKSIFLLFIVLFTSLQIQAQQKEITGTITDEDNSPLPGVSVVLKGTENVTTTDFDGKYSIKAKAGDVIVFKYVGEEIEKPVEEKSNISFVLEEPILEEWFCGGINISRIKDEITYQYVEIKFN